ncbi:MAG: DUF523 domain-containing protein [Clostridia bacterium]|nr:DUF523 domain-containing protein [Clostridia bacterium]
MFDDARSKQLVLVSHCILNQNAISDGTADYPGTFEDVLRILMDKKVGILQMPCPELQCLGLDRGDIAGSQRAVVEENTRIRQALLADNNLEKIDVLVENVFYQIKEYQKNGFNIVGIIGVDRSPSCGIHTTSEKNMEVEGRGVFMDRLTDALKKDGIVIKMVGVKTSKVEDAVLQVKALLA